MLPFLVANLPPPPAPAVRNPALDLTFDCALYNGIVYLTTEVTGKWANTLLIAQVIEVSSEITGDFIPSVFILAAPLDISIDVLTADVSLGTVNIPWISWSNIGSLDFTIGRDNIAGHRPMDLKGTVYGIKKLGNKIVIYGENGVSFLIPSSNLFGLETIYKVGLKGRGAFTGDNTKHFFIDQIGQLWKIDEGLNKIDYSEFLSTLTANLAMSYDVLNNLVIISDGITGFVYNPLMNSLGKGYSNVTGIAYQSSTMFVGAPAPVLTPPLNFCTDIYDFGNRQMKTISSMEIGTEVTEDLYASIDYRMDNKVPFKTLAFTRITPEGMAFIPCSGIEFRFRIKSLIKQDLQIDYLRINGKMHHMVTTNYVDWKD